MQETAGKNPALRPPKGPVQQRLEEMLRLAQGFLLLGAQAVELLPHDQELLLSFERRNIDEGFLYLLYVQSWLRNRSSLSYEVILDRRS